MNSFAFYTCYLGPDNTWSNMVHKAPSEQYNCYYFTNNTSTYSKAKDNGWIPILLNNPIENNDIKDCQHTKLLRCCPHLFDPLQKYDYLCYLDSKIWISNISKIQDLQKILQDNEQLVIVLSRHPFNYKNSWDEFHEAMLQERYKTYEQQYIDYIEHQHRSGYKDIPLRHCCGFSIRKQSDLMKRIGERWYTHICRCGIEDQISWQFVIQDFPNCVYEIPYKDCWDAP